MQTTRGDYPAAVRAGVRIIGGRLSAEDQNYGLDGRVAPSGAVRFAAGQTGDAFGHLWRAGAGPLANQFGRRRGTSIQQTPARGSGLRP